MGWPAARRNKSRVCPVPLRNVSATFQGSISAVGNVFDNVGNVGNT
jgi:hypothetical protein